MEAIMWTVFILSLFISTETVLGSDEDFRTEPSYIYCRRIFEFDGSVNTSGHIYSPEYEKGSYPNGLTCYYDIRVPEGWRIKVTFKDLDIVPTANCRFDKIDFYEQKGKKVLGIFCGSDIPRPIFSLKGDTLLKIAFHSDYLGSGRGFHIFYEASPYLEECPAEHIICKNRNCVPVSKKCDGIDDCEDGTDEQDCGFPLIVEPKECGTPAIPPKTVSSSPDRMVGGEAVIPNSWPWQVSLQKMYIEPNGHFCGGTLINAQWVVTATHCIAGNPFPENLKIHIGAHNKFKKGKYEQIRTAVKIIAYPDLERENIRKASFAHDITLVKLNAPVKFNDGVHPACLPSLGWHLKEGTSCYATGWGETRGSGGNEALKQMEQIVQPNATCSFNPKTQICVAKHNQSPCHGDSGGPLQCKVGEKWFVFGAASFVTTTNFVTGICTGPGAKTVYVNVADKIDWIRTLINKYS